MKKITYLLLLSTLSIYQVYSQEDVVNSLSAQNNTSHATSDGTTVWSHAFTVGGTAITLNEVKLNAFVGAGNATMRVTISDNPSLGSGMEIEDLGTNVISSTSEDNTETWTSSINPTLSANTTYYVHYIYVSGTASSGRWDASTTPNNTGTLGTILSNTVYQNGTVLPGFFLDMAVTGTDATLGTSNELINDKISLYPNPTSGILNIDLSLIENPSIKIFNNLGQIVRSETNINNKLLKFELTGNSGLYFIEVFDYKGNKALFKLIKK